MTEVEGYSPIARLWLETESGIIPLAQIAPHWIILGKPRRLAPQIATVAVSVDGRPPHRRRVRLDNREGRQQVDVEDAA